MCIVREWNDDTLGIFSKKKKKVDVNDPTPSDLNLKEVGERKSATCGESLMLVRRSHRGVPHWAAARSSSRALISFRILRVGRTLAGGCLGAGNIYMASLSMSTSR